MTITPASQVFDKGLFDKGCVGPEGLIDFSEPLDRGRSRRVQGGYLPEHPACSATVDQGQVTW